MLARTRLRRFAVGALSDEKHPFGPDCKCIGPIAFDCDGRPIEIMDSPTGYIGDRITEYGKASTGLPAIAVYVEQFSPSTFESGQFTTKIRVPLALTVEIYVTGETDWDAENALDALHERVMYRLMRREPVVQDECVYRTLLSMQPSQIRTNTERDVEDRRVFVRQIEIVVDQCDEFEAPDCTDPETLCVDVKTPLTPADC